MKLIEMRSVINKAMLHGIWNLPLRLNRRICTNRVVNRSSSGASGGDADFHVAIPKIVSLIGDYESQHRRNFRVATYEQVRDAPKKSNVWLIDVRDAAEIKATNSIPGAFNIPLNDLEAAVQFTSQYFYNRYGVTKPYHDSEIIFICRSGRRSKIAYELAESLGFTNLRNFDGGWLLYEQRCDFN